MRPPLREAEGTRPGGRADGAPHVAVMSPRRLLESITGRVTREKATSSGRVHWVAGCCFAGCTLSGFDRPGWAQQAGQPPLEAGGSFRPYYVASNPQKDTTLVFESRFESGNLRRAIKVRPKLPSKGGHGPWGVLACRELSFARLAGVRIRVRSCAPARHQHQGPHPVVLLLGDQHKTGEGCEVQHYQPHEGGQFVLRGNAAGDSQRKGSCCHRGRLAPQRERNRLLREQHQEEELAVRTQAQMEVPAEL